MVNSESMEAANDTNGTERVTQLNTAPADLHSSSPVTAPECLSFGGQSVSTSEFDTSPTPESAGETSIDITTLCCTVPLVKLQDISLDSKKKAQTKKFLCLYCDRTFVTTSLRQKHVDRCHSGKQIRRSSSRFQSRTTTVCIYCKKLNNTDHTLNELFRHLIEKHTNKYFACMECEERFSFKNLLDEHNMETHNFTEDLLENDFEDDKLRTKHKARKKDTDKDFEENPSLRLRKELRKRKVSVKSTKSGIKKQHPPTKTRKRKKGMEGDEKGKNSINPYPTFDAYFRVKKITDHSIDNLKISSLTFDDVFDKAFYNRIKCNIQENLQNHIDGKLFNNEESESRISNFEKMQEVSSTLSENFGCEITLNAATPVVSLLSSQLGEDLESQIEYGAKASKKKVPVNKDEVHYKYFTRRKYQASILQNKENRDLSKLDMWTQLIVKDRQQKIINDQKTDKEKIEYTKGIEYKTKMQNDELNRILDRRGPFEDLKEEANKMAAIEKMNRLGESALHVTSILDEIFNKVFEKEIKTEIEITDKTQELSSKPESITEIPLYLNLQRTSLYEEDIDRSDKITLICSSQETEDFQLSQTPRDKDKLVELTGEWTRTRLYICAACGVKVTNMKLLLDHKSVYHPNVWTQHYECVGTQSNLYRHLSIPGLGKVGHMEEYPCVKILKRSDARTCTKCSKACNSLAELHRHMLECGEDWSWMLARKKLKYRPFGSKPRRKRRGLVKRIIHKETPDGEPRPKRKYNVKPKLEGPRQRPSDAESIQRMLANLPAKRATRKLISMKDGISKPRRNKVEPASFENQHNHSQTNGQDTVQQKPASSTAPTKVLKCNPVIIRKSVRNINKVLGSKVLDNNSAIRMKRKLKSALLMRTRSRVDEMKPDGEQDFKGGILSKVKMISESVKKRIFKKNESKVENKNENIQESNDKATDETIKESIGTKIVQTLSFKRSKKTEDTTEKKSNINLFKSKSKKVKLKEKRIPNIAQVDGSSQISDEILPFLENFHLEERENDRPNACISFSQPDVTIEKTIEAQTFEDISANLGQVISSDLPEKNYQGNEKNEGISKSIIEDNQQDTIIKKLNSIQTEIILEDISENVEITKSVLKDENQVCTNENEMQDKGCEEKQNEEEKVEDRQIEDKVIEDIDVEDKANEDKNVEDKVVEDQQVDDNSLKEEILIESRAIESKPLVQHKLTESLLKKAKKKSKGLNDCIAMLTSKLQQKPEQIKEVITTPEKNEKSELPPEEADKCLDLSLNNRHNKSVKISSTIEKCHKKPEICSSKLNIPNRTFPVSPIKDPKIKNILPSLFNISPKPLLPLMQNLLPNLLLSNAYFTDPYRKLQDPPFVPVIQTVKPVILNVPTLNFNKHKIETKNSSKKSDQFTNKNHVILNTPQIEINKGLTDSKKTISCNLDVPFETIKETKKIDDENIFGKMNEETSLLSFKNIMLNNFDKLEYQLKNDELIKTFKEVDVNIEVKTSEKPVNVLIKSDDPKTEVKKKQKKGGRRRFSKKRKENINLLDEKVQIHVEEEVGEDIECKPNDELNDSVLENNEENESKSNGLERETPTKRINTRSSSKKKKSSRDVSIDSKLDDNHLDIDNTIDGTTKSFDDKINTKKKKEKFEKKDFIVEDESTRNSSSSRKKNMKKNKVNDAVDIGDEFQMFLDAHESDVLENKAFLENLSSKKNKEEKEIELNATDSEDDLPLSFLIKQKKVSEEVVKENNKNETKEKDIDIDEEKVDEVDSPLIQTKEIKELDQIRSDENINFEKVETKKVKDLTKKQLKDRNEEINSVSISNLQDTSTLNNTIEEEKTITKVTPKRKKRIKSKPKNDNQESEDSKLIEVVEEPIIYGDQNDQVETQRTLIESPIMESDNLSHKSIVNDQESNVCSTKCEEIEDKTLQSRPRQGRKKNKRKKQKDELTLEQLEEFLDEADTLQRILNKTNPDYQDSKTHNEEESVEKIVIKLPKVQQQKRRKTKTNKNDKSMKNVLECEESQLNDISSTITTPTSFAITSIVTSTSPAITSTITPVITPTSYSDLNEEINKSKDDEENNDSIKNSLLDDKKEPLENKLSKKKTKKKPKESLLFTDSENSNDTTNKKGKKIKISCQIFQKSNKFLSMDKTKEIEADEESSDSNHYERTITRPNPFQIPVIKEEVPDATDDIQDIQTEVFQPQETNEINPNQFEISNSFLNVPEEMKEPEPVVNNPEEHQICNPFSISNILQNINRQNSPLNIVQEEIVNFQHSDDQLEKEVESAMEMSIEDLENEIRRKIQLSNQMLQGQPNESLRNEEDQNDNSSDDEIDKFYNNMRTTIDQIDRIDDIVNDDDNKQAEVVENVVEKEIKKVDKKSKKSFHKKRSELNDNLHSEESDSNKEDYENGFIAYSEFQINSDSTNGINILKICRKKICDPIQLLTDEIYQEKKKSKRSHKKSHGNKKKRKDHSNGEKIQNDNSIKSVNTNNNSEELIDLQENVLNDNVVVDEKLELESGYQKDFDDQDRDLPRNMEEDMEIEESPANGSIIENNINITQSSSLMFEHFYSDKSNIEIIHGNEIIEDNKSNNEIIENDKSINEIIENDKSINEIVENDKPNNEIIENDKSINEIIENDKSNNEIIENDKSFNDIIENDKLNNEIIENDKSNNEIIANDKSNNEILENDQANNEIAENDESNNEIVENIQLNNEITEIDNLKIDELKEILNKDSTENELNLLDDKLETKENEEVFDSFEIPVKTTKFRGKKGKGRKGGVRNRREKLPGIENLDEVYCDICNRSFTRMENLVKHKKTLTHIAKLSEIEAREAEIKAKLLEKEEQRKSEILEKEEQKKSNILEKEDIPFSLKPSTLNLVDIINDVLDKPIEKENNLIDNYISNSSNSNLETKRYKSLGERKSFESDINSTYPFNTIPIANEKIPTATVLKQQLTILENIIERGYIDDITESSKSGLSDNKSENFNNFVKPSTQYEEISNDSLSVKNQFEEQSHRKVLNRDEALFLECCSLLKSSSEVSDFSKKSSKQILENTFDMKQSEEPEWLETKSLNNQPLQLEINCFDNSCPNTPLGDGFGDEYSNTNSNTIATDWSTKQREKDNDTNNRPEDNNDNERKFIKLRESYISENEDCVISDVENDKLWKTPKKNKSSEITQTSIMDYAIPISMKNEDIDNKKVMTKGAMKVFEGLKVSIPTDDLNLKELLNGTYSKKEEDIFCDDQTKKIDKKNIIQTFGNSLGLKITKKKHLNLSKDDTTNAINTNNKEKIDDIEKKNPDVYDFEETQDNTDLFGPKLSTIKEFRSKEKEKKLNEVIIDKDVQESDSESQGWLDNFGFDAQSMSSYSSESTQLSIKQTAENSITKKKCMIMGRIFKNAFKANNVKDLPTIDNAKFVEDYVNQLPEQKTEKRKMSQEEMDDLFNKLLDDSIELKQSENDHREFDEPKEEQRRGAKPKNDFKKVNAKGSKRKRQRNNSGSTDDEFSINKPRRTCKKKSKNVDNSINLEQELRECIGVASRKSQRSCTSGKQNVLVEYWSSDDSNFEAFIKETIYLESTSTQKSRQKSSQKLPQKSSQKSSEKSPKLKSPRPKSIEPQIIPSPPTPNNNSSESKRSNHQDTELPIKPPSPITTPKSQIKTSQQQKSRSVDNSNKLKQPGRRKSTNKTSKSKKSVEDDDPEDKQLKKVKVTGETLASNRRKRPAADTLYYWSSSSEDESRDFIETKPIRDEIDDDDDDDDMPVQHGWIVGESTKKLVTMLAQAKGKKTDTDCVKEQGRKRTTI